jgi:hypothetical protein
MSTVNNNTTNAYANITMVRNICDWDYFNSLKDNYKNISYDDRYKLAIINDIKFYAYKVEDFIGRSYICVIDRPIAVDIEDGNWSVEKSLKKALKSVGNDVDIALVYAGSNDCGCPVYSYWEEYKGASSPWIKQQETETAIVRVKLLTENALAKELQRNPIVLDSIGKLAKLFKESYEIRLEKIKKNLMEDNPEDINPLLKYIAENEI